MLSIRDNAHLKTAGDAVKKMTMPKKAVPRAAYLGQRRVRG